MIAKAIFRINGEEIKEVLERNEKYSLDTEIPKDKIVEDDFHFRLKDVSYVHINSDGNLNVLISGQIWSLKYNKELHSEIIKSIEND